MEVGQHYEMSQVPGQHHHQQPHHQPLIQVEQSAIMHQSPMDAPQTMPNPWEVNNVQDFCFYCCPECTFRSHKVVPFQEHAIASHPLGKTFFESGRGSAPSVMDTTPITDKEPVDIKPPPPPPNQPISRPYPPQPVNAPWSYMDTPPIMVKADPQDVNKVVKILAAATGQAPKAAPSGAVKKTIKKVKRKPAVSSSSSFSSGPIEIDWNNLPKVDPNLLNADSTLAENVDEKRFQCMFCPEKYSKLYGLGMHMNLFHDVGRPKKIPCPACNHIAVTGPKLKEHIEMTHGDGLGTPLKEPTTYICDVEGCEYVTNAKANMANHKARHGGQTSCTEVLKCDVEGCDYETVMRGVLLKHKDSKHGPKKEVCDQCGQAFRYISQLKQHQENVHMGVRYFCEKCGQGFTSKAGLQTHSKKTPCDLMSRRDIEYICDRCPNIPPYTSIKGYISHYRRNHGSFPDNLDKLSLDLVYCEQCPEIFMHNNSLKHHRRVVHEGKLPASKAGGKKTNEKHQCPHCEKLFYKGNSLTEHIKSKHENDTPFKCKECPKSYGTESFLRMHMQQTHSQLKCHICGKSIRSKLWFKRHMAQAHGILPEGGVQCDHCSVVFDSPDNLQRHVATKHS